jgi:hypothetical protein
MFLLARDRHNETRFLSDDRSRHYKKLSTPFIGSTGVS